MFRLCRHGLEELVDEVRIIARKDCSGSDLFNALENNELVV